MKMKLKNLFLLTFMFALVFAGCKPEDENMDYREKYTGNWNFDVTISEFYMADSLNSEEKFSYVGEVSLGSSEEDIIIHYLEDDYITLTVDEDGVLSGFSTPYSSGEFEDVKHLRIFFRWGGMGGGGSHSIIAIR